MKRVDDPVVVEAEILEPLLGASLDRITLMRWHTDGFFPIPFQVDEKDATGEYAFTHGPKAGDDPDPRLDANDELVFMVSEAGDRGYDGAWPEGASSGAQIEVQDPLDRGKGWLYLFQFKDNPPRSNKDLVSIDLDFSNQRIRVQTPEFIIESPSNAIYPDVIRAVHEDGPGPDILDRLKIRARLKTIGGLSLLLKFDDLMKTRPTAWIDGPVRAIYRGDGYLEFSIIKIRLSGYSVISYYPNHMIWPMTLSGSANLSSIITDIVVYGYMDWNSNIFGTHPYDQFNPYHPEVIWDGRVSESEQALEALGDRHWIAGIGPEGAIVFRIINDPPREGSINKLYFMDDITISDPPEDDVGVACMGLKIENYGIMDQERPKQEQGTTYQYYYYKHSLRPGQEKMILDIIDHPLQVKVTEIPGPQ